MSKTKEQPLSAEGVTLQAQDAAAAAQDDESVDAVLEISELQHGGELGETERWTRRPPTRQARSSPTPSATPPAGPAVAGRARVRERPPRRSRRPRRRGDNAGASVRARPAGGGAGQGIGDDLGHHTQPPFHGGPRRRGARREARGGDARPGGAVDDHPARRRPGRPQRRTLAAETPRAREDAGAAKILEERGDDRPKARGGEPVGEDRCSSVEAFRKAKPESVDADLADGEQVVRRGCPR
jgi:hypothetical protein